MEREERVGTDKILISCSSQSPLSGVGKYIESDGTDKVNSVNVSAYYEGEKRE